jgi:uncharacterized protein (DUF433 family)
MIPSPIDIPIHTDEDGVIRVGNTRIPLETVIHAFQRGETPEQIVESFDVLKLLDVYAVFTYYIRDRHEVDAYMHRVETESAAMRREIESRNTDILGFRERLIARMEAQKSHL